MLSGCNTTPTTKCLNIRIDLGGSGGRGVVGLKIGLGPIWRKKLRDVQQEHEGTSLNYFNVLFNYCQAQPKPKPKLGAEIALISKLS